MKKGVSIPINTLVMLAVAIIVLLAAVAWFMGAFAPTATSSNLKQRFDTSCISWTTTNCKSYTHSAGCALADTNCGYVPTNVCRAYVAFQGADDTVPGNLQTFCSNALGTLTNYEKIARACGCSKPYGNIPP